MQIPCPPIRNPDVSVTNCRNLYLCGSTFCHTVSTFKTKPNVLSHDIQGIDYNLEQICSDCHRQILNCEACRFMNSQFSLDQMKELRILRQSMDLVKLADGTFRVRVDYPLKSDPFVTFHPRNAQIHAVKMNSIRLRNKLIKLGMFDCFTKQITDAVADNHLEIVPNDDVMVGPTNFCSINYQLKNSQSTPIRLTTNSSYPNKIGKSLNSESVTGPSYLGNGPQVLLNFRRHDFAYNSDISKFYRQILTTNTTNRLRRIFWYLKESDEELTCFQYIRSTYGDASISILTEIIFIDYISQACETKELAEACLTSRLVDDVCHSVPTLSQVYKVRDDMNKTFKKYNFGTKHFLFSGMNFENDQPKSAQVLGTRWQIDTDQLFLETEINISPKHRGKYKLSSLDLEQAKNGHIDKNAASRVNGQLFDYLGSSLTPAQCTGRILFSRICQKVKVWNQPIKIEAPELDLEFRNFLIKLIDLKNKINPIPRPIAFKSTIRKIFLSSDASGEALGFTMHIYSINSLGKAQCNLLCSRTKVHKSTIPIAEFQAVTKACRELLSVFKMTPSYFSSLPDIIFSTDSSCTTFGLSPGKIHQNVALKNNAYSVHSILTDLSNLIPGVVIKMVHLKSGNIAADLVTRKHNDPVAICNSKLYRQGPPLYMDPSFPSKERVFLEFKLGKVKYTTPKTEQAIERSDKLNGCTDADPSPCHLCLPGISDTSPGHRSNISQTPPSYIPVPVLDKDMYYRLLQNCRSLQLVISTIKFIVKGLNLAKCSVDQSDETLSEFSFKIIIKSHQYHYPSHKEPTMAQVFMDADNIKRCSIRMDSSLGPALLWSNLPYLVNNGDKRLIWLLISRSHTGLTGLKASAHLGITLTAANLLRPPYPVWLFNAEKLCSDFIHKCPVCNYLHKQPTATGSLSLPRLYHFIHKNNIVFHTISVDSLGPFLIRAYQGSRKSVKVWIQIFVDMATRFTHFEVMQGNTLVDVTAAIFRFSSLFQRPQHIISDAGSSANLNPKSLCYQQYFGSAQIQTTKVAASHQFLNLAESQVASTKRLLRSIFHQREKLNLSTLTHSELETVLLGTAALLNSRPIFRSKNAFLSPNKLTQP